MTTRPEPHRPVAIVGAGWAGLAAAIELAEHGVKTVVFDSAPQAGGRARRVDLELGGVSCALDNGQHLLVGAYRDALGLLRRIGAQDQAQRLPMQLRSCSGLRLRAASLPAPWHLAAALLTSRGLSVAQRWQMIRLLAALRFSGWRVAPACTVTQLLRGNGQSAALTQLLWQPLCIATLNTDVDAACGQTFANVLRDTLGADRAASDFVFARRSLTELFVDPALVWLQNRGGQLRLRQAVRTIARDPTDKAWQVHSDQGTELFQAVIIAVPPSNAARLLDAPNSIGARLNAFRYEPIATCYLAWTASAVPTLPAPIMLDESLAEHRYGQWLFDRGVFDGAPGQPSMRVAAVVVSAAARALLREQADHESHGTIDLLTAAIGQQVCAQLKLPPAIAVRTIVEKRATFRCTPDRPVLRANSLVQTDPSLSGLWLAGDYCWPEYPATLEAAVRSGLAAARLCVNS